MAPFRWNMNEVGIVSSSNNKQEMELYARVDDEWRVLVVPNGGYLLGLVLQACNLVQADSPQCDPLYLSAQFLGSSFVGPCTIHVKRIKSGRSYCNLTAELSQKGQSNLHVQLIYGHLEIAKHPFGPFPASKDYLTLSHPSGLSRRCPISIHPSKCSITPFTRPYLFMNRLVQAIDPYYTKRMEDLANNQPGENVDLGGSGFMWGGWYEMVDEDEVLSYSLVSFLADVSPVLIPESWASKRETNYWVPTLGMAIDFKYRIPDQSELLKLPGIAPRTVGVFHSSKYLIEGRHDVTSEIWTSPSAIGQGIEDPEGRWRDQMFCLAIVTQCATSVPATMNTKHEKKGVEVAKL